MAHGDPDLSVVMATNRNSPFLTEAVDSVRDQTHSSIELIVIDDGSPCPDVISDRARRHPHARVIRQDPSGVSAARNVGAAAARGEVLAFVDDDDRWHPTRAEAHVAAHRESPGADLVFSIIRNINAAGKVVGFSPSRVDVSAESIATGAAPLLMPNVTVRREAFTRAGGFHTSLRYAEDEDLILRLCQHRLPRFIAEPLVDYREHPNNTVKRHRELVSDINAVLRLHLAGAESLGDREWVDALRAGIRRNDRYAWWTAVRAARRYWRTRDGAGIASEIAWAWRQAPTGLFAAVANRARTAGAGLTAGRRTTTPHLAVDGQTLSPGADRAASP